MEFLQLNAFFLLIFPLILFLFLLLKKQNSFDSYFSQEVLEKITISNKLLSSNFKNTLLVLCLILFIIAVARPVIDEKEHKIKEDLIPIIVAIDVSKSMLAADIYPDRLALAKQKLLKILQTSKKSAIGVVLFAKSAFVLSPVTQDFTSLSFLVQNLDSGLNFDNGSNVLAMLEASNDLLENYNSKNIILLSDGGNKKNYDKEIEFANSKNIKVYAIGLASSKRSPIPMKDGYLTDKEGKIITVGLNKNISKLGLKSGGGYIDFSLNLNDIDEVLKDISREAKKEHMSSTKIKTYTELFYYPLALAMFLLLVCFSSLSLKRAKTTALTLILLSIVQTESQADLLDFNTLQNAKEAYNNKDFEKSENLYKEVNENAQTQYNIANTLYKQGKYKEALETYKSVETEDKNLQYQTLHNIGNSYVKQKDLESAKKAYEDALKLQEDKQTKQNLETVKKALEEKKKQENKKQDKNKKNNKDKKENKKEQKDKKNKNEKQKDDKKNNEKKDDKSQKKKQEGKDAKGDKSKTKNNEKKDDKKTQEQKQKDASKQGKTAEEKNKEHISDLEEKKWLNKLKNQKNQTFLRRYKSKSSEENIENPW